MQWVGADKVGKTCDLGLLIAALEEGHRGSRPEVTDGLIGPEKARYLIRSAHDGSRLLGTKLITIFQENPDRHGLPSVQAIVVLFDGETGRAKAAIEATAMTYWKTAADSALGSKYLARPESRTLALAGAGGLAPWLVRGHMTVHREIERVFVWNRTPARAEILAAQLRGEGIHAEVACDLETAVRTADIVTTATMASEPILRGAWLKPGAHVDLVGSFSPDTREADDETLRRARLFVDCRDSALDGVGDIVAPLRSGVITEQDIVGDLFDIVGGMMEGRRGGDEITVFKNAGGAHLDLMAAAALIESINPE